MRKIGGMLMMDSGRRSAIAKVGSWLASALLAFALPIAADEIATPRAPFILIVVDTLRADHLHSHGATRATSPNVDRLASEAVHFKRAYSQAPWTTASFASLLTSQFPAALGITDIASPLPSHVEVLPSFLRRNGYVTAGVVSHTFISRKWGFARGFDHFDESNIADNHGVSTVGVSNLGIAKIDALKGQPFFLLLHYFDPHFPYLEHEGFRFPSEDPGYAGVVRSGVKIKELRRAARTMSAADEREMRRIYDSEIAFTDHQIGRILDHLRKLGLYDKSLIILTADHGEEFLDHGAVGHTRTVYNELLHVPLIIKPPNATAAVVETPVALVDAFPTAAALLGLELDLPAQGRDLFAARAEAVESPVFSETSRGASLRSVVLGDYKLIEDGVSGKVQLYDVVADPKELEEVAARHPEVVSRMRPMLSEWFERIQKRIPPPERVDVSDGEREHLRALGYVE